MKKNRSNSKFLTQNPAKKLIIQINVKSNKNKGHRKSCLHQKNNIIPREKNDEPVLVKKIINDPNENLVAENIKNFNQSLEGEANIITKLIGEEKEQKNVILEKLIQKSRIFIQDVNDEYVENLPFKKKSRNSIKDFTTEKRKNEITEDNTEEKKEPNRDLFKTSWTKNSRILSKGELVIANDDNPELYNEVLHKFQNVYDSLSENEMDVIGEKNKVVFLLNLKQKRYFDYFMIFLIIYSEFSTFLEIAFTLRSLMINEVILEIFFLVDIILNFFTPFTNEIENEVNNFSKIAINYLNNWFFIDLCSFSPFSIIQLLFFEQHALLHTGILKLSSPYFIGKWLKVARIIKLFKYEFIGNLQLINKSKLNTVLKSTIFFFMLTFTSSCFLIYLGMSQNSTSNWINKINLNNQSYLDIFIASLYFNLVSIYTIGYGDIILVNIQERFYNIFLLIFGVMFFSYAVSSLSSLFVAIDQKTTLFNEKLDFVDNINCEFEIPLRLYQGIRQNVIVQYERNNYDNFQLLDSLPTHIKNQLTTYMYKVLIKDLKFFSNQPHDFILYVLPFLKTHKIKRGEILFSSGELVEEIYLVVKGSLGLNLDLINEQIELGIIRDNFHFGELLMLTKEPSPYELKCKSRTAEILVLRSSDFLKIKNSFNLNVMKILKDSYRNFEIFDRRRHQFLELKTFKTNKYTLKQLLQKINIYLFTISFDDYYYKDIDFISASDFIMNTKYEDIIKTIENTEEINQSQKKAIEENKIKSLISSKKNLLDETFTSFDHLERSELKGLVKLDSPFEDSSNLFIKNKMMNSELKTRDRINSCVFNPHSMMMNQISQKSRKSSFDNNKKIKRTATFNDNNITTTSNLISKQDKDKKSSEPSFSSKKKKALKLQTRNIMKEIKKDMLGNHHILQKEENELKKKTVNLINFHQLHKLKKSKTRHRGVPQINITNDDISQKGKSLIEVKRITPFNNDSTKGMKLFIVNESSIEILGKCDKKLVFRKLFIETISTFEIKRSKYSILKSNRRKQVSLRNNYKNPKYSANLKNLAEGISQIFPRNTVNISFKNSFNVESDVSKRKKRELKFESLRSFSKDNQKKGIEKLDSVLKLLSSLKKINT